MCYKIKNLTFEGIKNHHFLSANVQVGSDYSMNETAATAATAATTNQAFNQSTKQAITTII
jgi:hypothetical protein